MRAIRLLAGALLLGTATLTQALSLQPYSAQALADAQQAGKPVALHFHADWCPVCAEQQRALKAIQDGPTVLVANYDQEAELKRQHRVRAQSTLLVFKGHKETARVVGDSQPAALAKALQSAQ